jgi:hypothetical protein
MTSLGFKLPLRTLLAVDPDLGRLVAGEVGPPARSVVSASDQLAFDADERNLNNRIRHERVSLKRSETKRMTRPWYPDSLGNSYNRCPLDRRIAKRKEGNQMTLSRKTFWIGGGLVALTVLIVVLVLVYSGGGSGGGGY